MKFFHLSDLHIGRRLNDVSLLEDQAYILHEILKLADSERPEAILISGDVYDKSVPSAEAVTLFDSFLVELARRQIPTLVISGNHDSPERLAFGSRLMEGSGIHISPVYSGAVEPVTVQDSFGPVRFWLLPFVKPAHVKRFYPEENMESYTDAIRVAVEKMGINPEERNVLLTHQFVTGSVTCESEELSIGGSDNVDAAVFEGFDYVALGHIHGPQNMGSGRIRYCGTPLKYSLSEQRHYKSVTLAELGEKGNLTLRALPLTPKRDLRKIRGTFGELTDREFYETQAREDYLYVELTDEEDIPEAMGKLRQIYPNILHLGYDNTRTRTNQVIGAAEDVRRKSPLELFEELYTLQNNQPMQDCQREFVTELMKVIWEETV